MRRVDKMRIIILTMLLYGMSFMSLVHIFSAASGTSGKLTGY